MSICHRFICFVHFTPLIRDQNEGIAEIILAKKKEFSIFSSYISHYDEKLNYLEHIQSTVRDFFSLIANTIRIKSMLFMDIHQPAKLFSTVVQTVLCDFCVLYCLITFECFCVYLHKWRVFVYFSYYIACFISQLPDALTLKKQLLQVIVRILQYRMLLTGDV